MAETSPLVASRGTARLVGRGCLSQGAELDPEFAPAMFHLTEYAVRRGDVARAGSLVEKFAQGHPDSGPLGSARLMLECVRGGVTAPVWRAAVLRNPADVLAAGQLLAVGGLRQSDCAQAAFEAVLAFDRRGPKFAPNKFGAFIGLQGVRVARGRDDAAKTVLDSDTLFNQRTEGICTSSTPWPGAPSRRRQRRSQDLS